MIEEEKVKQVIAVLDRRRCKHCGTPIVKETDSGYWIHSVPYAGDKKRKYNCGFYNRELSMGMNYAEPEGE